MTKNFDNNVLNQDENGADIQLLDWVNGADYGENDAEVISAEQIA